MCRIVGILFSIVMMACWTSAFTIEADFPIADSPNIYTTKPDCVSFSDNIFIKIPGCMACGNCPLPKGRNHTISAGFTPRTSLTTIGLHYDVTFFGLNVKSKDKNDIPAQVSAGQPFTFQEDFELSSTVPTGPYKITLRVYDSADTGKTKPLICINECAVTVTN